MHPIDEGDLERVEAGHHQDPARSMSLRAEAYTEPMWFAADQQAIFARTWQLVCHLSQLTTSGSYVTTTIADAPILVVRGDGGGLRAFYNVCTHRAHELASGAGVAKALVCPYHAWTFGLDGRLKAARKTESMPDFDWS